MMASLALLADPVKLACKAIPVCPVKRASLVEPSRDLKATLDSTDDLVCLASSASLVSLACLAPKDSPARIDRRSPGRLALLVFQDAQVSLAILVKMASLVDLDRSARVATIVALVPPASRAHLVNAAIRARTAILALRAHQA